MRIKHLAVVVLLWLCCSCGLFAKPIEVDYLVPADFRGGVLILYNQPDGVEPEKTQDGTLVYKIPKDGFLKIKPKFERKNYKFKYYFVDAQAKRTEIEYLYQTTYVRDRGDTTSRREGELSEAESNNAIFVMNSETHNFSIPPGERVFVQTFIVYTEKDSLRIYSQTMHKVSDIQRKMLGMPNLHENSRENKDK